MAVEDFTTYTLASAGGTIAVTSTRATQTAFPTRGPLDGYVQKDAGAGHFSGDFSHLLTMQIDSQVGTALNLIWRLTLVGGDHGAANDYLMLFAYDSNVSGLILRQYHGGTYTDDTWNSTTLGVAYYLRLTRVSSAVTCYIYTDSGRTTLVKTLAVTEGSIGSYRYISVASGFNVDGGALVSGYVENLDLQEGGGGGTVLHPMSLL